MNEVLQQFARNELKAGLAKCTPAQQDLFKRIYANGKLDLPINTVVDRMPEEKLDRAMDQVARTVQKNEANPILEVK